MASSTSGDHRHHRGNRPCWTNRVSCWPVRHLRWSSGHPRRTRCCCYLSSRWCFGCPRDRLLHPRLHDCRLLPRRDLLRRDPSFRLRRHRHGRLLLSLRRDHRSLRRSSRLPVRGLPAGARWIDARPAMTRGSCRRICQQSLCSSKACRRGATGCAASCRLRQLPRGCRRRRCCDSPR